MIYLIDANMIIRFLVGDDEEFLTISTEYFGWIETGTIQVEILSSVLMEAFFVLTKLYKIPKNEAIQDLKAILSLKGVVNENKIILMETLILLEHKNIDFVDALIRSKSNSQDYVKLSLSNIRIDLTKI